MSNVLFTITLNEEGFPSADFDSDKLQGFLIEQGPAGKLFALSAIADITNTIVTMYDELDSLNDESNVGGGEEGSDYQ